MLYVELSFNPGVIQPVIYSWFYIPQVIADCPLRSFLTSNFLRLLTRNDLFRHLNVRKSHSSWTCCIKSSLQVENESTKWLSERRGTGGEVQGLKGEGVYPYRLLTTSDALLISLTVQPRGHSTLCQRLLNHHLSRPAYERQQKTVQPNAL